MKEIIKCSKIRWYKNVENKGVREIEKVESKSESNDKQRRQLARKSEAEEAKNKDKGMQIGASSLRGINSFHVRSEARTQYLVDHFGLIGLTQKPLQKPNTVVACRCFFYDFHETQSPVTLHITVRVEGYAVQLCVCQIDISDSDTGLYRYCMA